MSRIGYVVVQDRGMFGQRLVDTEIINTSEYAIEVAASEQAMARAEKLSDTYFVAEVVALDGAQ